MAAYNDYDDFDDEVIVSRSDLNAFAASGELDFDAWRKARRQSAAPAPVDYRNTPHPQIEADARYQAVLDAGGRAEDAMAASIDTLLQAAMAGDKRAIVEPDRR